MMHCKYKYFATAIHINLLNLLITNVVNCQSSIQVNLYVDGSDTSINTSMSNDCTNNLEPCFLFDEMISSMNEQLENINNISLHMINSVQTDYEWNETLSIKSNDSDTPSTYSMYGSDPNDASMTRLVWDDSGTGTDYAIYSSYDNRFDITINDLTIVDKQGGTNINGNGYFFYSGSCALGDQKLTFNNVVLGNLSRSNQFFENDGTGCGYGIGSSSVLMYNTLIIDSHFSSEMYYSYYGGKINLTNVIFDNITTYESLFYIRYPSSIANTSMQFQNVTFNNVNIEGYWFIEYYYYSSGDRNDFIFIDIEINKCDYIYGMIESSGGYYGNFIISDMIVSESNFDDGLWNVYEQVYGNVYITDIIIDSSSFDYIVFYFYSDCNYHVNYTNEELYAPSDYTIITNQYQGLDFVIENFELINSKAEDIFEIWDFESVYLNNWSIYFTNGLNITSGNYSYYYLGTFENYVCTLETTFTNIYMANFTTYESLYYIYESRELNFSNIYLDNVLTRTYFYFDMEQYGEHYQTYWYSNNVTINGRYLDYGYNNNGEEYANNFEIESIAYVWVVMSQAYHNLTYDCDDYVVEFSDWTFIDIGLSGPAWVTNTDETYQCNKTFSRFIVTNNTYIGNNGSFNTWNGDQYFWVAWDYVTYEKIIDFERPPSLFLDYLWCEDSYSGDDCIDGSMTKLDYETNHTIIIEDSIFEYNSNFTITMCGKYSHCRVYFKNCVFNSNYITMTDKNGTYQTLWNAIWMHDESDGVLIFEDCVFIGDYDNQIGGIESSWLYDFIPSNSTSTFECRNCKFRQNLPTVAPTEMPTIIPTNQPTEPSLQPTMTPTQEPTYNATYQVSFYITLSGSFIFESDDNDDGTIDSQDIDSDDFIIVEEILTVAVGTILDENNIEYDSLSVNVESLSTTQVEALVVITNATIKSDNLIEIVEESIIVEIENEDDSGDVNFIITDVETETAESNTKTNTNNDKNNNGKNDYTAFIAIAVTFGAVVLIVTVWFAIDIKIKQRKNEFKKEVVVSMMTSTGTGTGTGAGNNSNGNLKMSSIASESGAVTSITGSDVANVTDVELVQSGDDMDVLPQIPLPEQPKIDANAINSTPGNEENFDNNRTNGVADTTEPGNTLGEGN